MHASAKRRGEELRETRQQHKMEPRCHVLQARSEVVEVNRPLFSTNRGPQQVTEPCEPVWKGCSHETGRIPRIPLLRFDHGLPLLPFSDLRGQRFTELLSVRVSLYYACSVLLKWRLLRDCCYKQITLLTILPLKISFIFCELCAPLSKKGQYWDSLLLVSPKLHTAPLRKGLCEGWAVLAVLESQTAFSGGLHCIL